MSKKFLFIGSVLLFFILIETVNAKIVKSYTLSQEAICFNESSLIVISAHEIPYLLGHDIDNLSFFNYSHGLWQAISFQIDQKDKHDRYIITQENQTVSSNIAEIKNGLSDNDELVFRKVDLAERLDPLAEQFKQYSLLEIELINDQGEPSAWVYINISSQNIITLFRPLLLYDKEKDSLVAPVYKMGFSKIFPFLVDSLHWWLPQKSQWSPDISDTMKIRHTGKFLGFPFKRTHGDYYSRLIGIKKGTLRIIRRTENRVKIFWKLKSPVLYIDYVMMPDGFVMDSMIDIPFKIALFFSELETLTSIDWKNDYELPALFIHTSDSKRQYRFNLPVNGKHSVEKNAFNQLEDKRFSISSSMGKIDVRMDIPDEFPIQSNLFLYDDLDEIDLPENYPGQFGNVGYRTVGWENIDSELYHLKLTVCMSGM